MSCPRRTGSGSGSNSSGSWSYSWSSGPNGVTYTTQGNVPQEYLQKIPGGNRTVTSTTTKPVVKEQIVHSSTSDTQWGWRQAVLDRHNLYRRRHGAPDMTLDTNVNNMAQKTADYLAGRRMMAHVSKQTFGHSYGENLYSMQSSGGLPNKEKSAIDATDAWYNEVRQYNYSSPGFSMGTGHFTQVVWKESTKLGVGVATNGNWLIVVGQYSPHGNMQGSFQRNVSPRQ